MITITVVTSTRWTSRTRNSSSSPNNTDVASDMLVASLLDVVEDQQHVGATSLSTATTRASRHPAQVRRAGFVVSAADLEMRGDAGTPVTQTGPSPCLQRKCGHTRGRNCRFSPARG